MYKILLFYKKNLKRAKSIMTKFSSVSITRAGITANPLEMYNPVSLTTVPNNTLVKNGDTMFVGGDTDTLEYDFFTKVAGSNVECPMKIYRTVNAIIQPPTNITGTFFEATQTEIDKLKTQDGTFIVYTDSTNGNIAQLMIELDLTPLCNAMFGGSNAALKSALKSINVDVWAMGSGANASVLTNGCRLAIWNNFHTAWTDGGYRDNASSVFPANLTGSISKVTLNTKGDTSVNGYADRCINASNKVYFLVNSSYPSDGTIPSSVSLDYLKVTVQLSRVPDTVTSIPVKLPNYWAMVVKGFSPIWDNNTTKGGRRIFRIKKDSNNYYDLQWDLSAKQWRFDKKYSGSTTSLMSSTPTFNKNQVYNFLLGQNSNGMFMYLLKNNDVVDKKTNANTSLISDTSSLYIECVDSVGFEADSFLDNLTLIDLTNKPSGFTDAEALSILKGQMHIKENNLVSNSDFSNGTTGWIPSNGTGSASNNIYSNIGNGTSNFPYVMQNLNVITGNKYYTRAIARVTNSVCQNITLRLESATNADAIVANPVINTWYTLSNICTETVTSTRNIYVWQWYADNATANNKELQVKEVQCINLTTLFGAGLEPSLAQCDTMFSQGTTNPVGLTNPELFDINSVSLHANASRSNGVITLNASANYQGSYLSIPVLPNNQYTISFVTNGKINIQTNYNNVVLNVTLTSKYDSGTLTFITSSNCNRLVIGMENGSRGTGTFTFSNISLKRKD